MGIVNVESRLHQPFVYLKTIRFSEFFQITISSLIPQLIQSILVNFRSSVSVILLYVPFELSDGPYLGFMRESRSQNNFLGETLLLSRRMEGFFSCTFLVCVAEDSDLHLEIYICSIKFHLVFLQHILQFSSSF